jgi:hypothetical protein
MWDENEALGSRVVVNVRRCWNGMRARWRTRTDSELCCGEEVRDQV